MPATRRYVELIALAMLLGLLEVAALVLCAWVLCYTLDAIWPRWLPH